MNISLKCFQISLISIVDQLEEAAPALVKMSSKLGIVILQKFRKTKDWFNRQNRLNKVPEKARK